LHRRQVARKAPRAGRVINVFDPWSSPLCTCPLKYSLNPYTGCSHFCLYCYATAYIGVKPSTPKRDYKRRLLADIESGRLDPRYHIDISTSSDPYPPEEKKHSITRWTLEQLLPRGYRVLVITKSSLVTRDKDVLSRGNAAVTITVTSVDASLARRLEPGAPPPQERIGALRALSQSGVPVGLRLDPVFPHITDSDDQIRAVLEQAYDAGARFVVTSTYKARPDSLRRMLQEFPEHERHYRELYQAKGEWMHGYWYLPYRLRVELMLRVRRIALELGMEYATCREGLQSLHTAPTCDGSHLIPKRVRPQKAARPPLDRYLG